MREAFDPVLFGIGVVAMFVLLVDTTYPIARDYVLEPVWTLGIYGALPFGAAVAASVRRHRVASYVAALGVACLLVPICGRAWFMPRGAFDSRPEVLIAFVAAGSVLVAAGARLGRFDLDTWGAGLGQWRWWLPRLGLLFALIVPGVGIAALVSPELLAYYPEYPPARTDGRILLFYQLANGLYMLGWEFFFRGFLTFGVASRAGAKVAILLPAIPFLLLHRNKPELEMVSSFLGSMVLSAWCLRARTFLPSVLLHWGLNLTMELLGFFF